MFLKNLFFILFVVLFFSCKKATTTAEILTVNDSIQTNAIVPKSSLVPLTRESQLEVENWEEYQKLNDFLAQYKNITMRDALFNAKDLANLAQQLKDSIRIEKFKTPSVKIRLNVLHNETLRLADMAEIKTISEQEVIEENENILNAFSALNLKINNLISQENLNSDVDEFIQEILQNPDSLGALEKLPDNNLSRE